MYLSSPASPEVQSLRGFNYFLHLKGGCVGVGSILLHQRNHRSQQISTELQILVSGFESTSSKPVSANCGVDSEYSPSQSGTMLTIIDLLVLPLAHVQPSYR